MPMQHTPPPKATGEAPPTPEPSSTPATGAVPKTSATSQSRDLPATPSKGITKASKAELLDIVGKLRAHLGKATDAQTKARYESYNKDKLVEEYYNLRAMAEAPKANPDPKRDPGAAAPQPTAEMAQLLVQLEHQRLQIEEQRRDMERQRHDDLLRAEEQRRADEEQRRRDQERADRRLEALIESLRVDGGAPP